MSTTITRKYIKRITKREGNTSIRQSGGGGGGGGGASQYWVDENYISKLFFNQLFTVYDEDGNVVEPNDTESVIASIKSMFGFWTDAYLSALGNGEGGGAELTLASLADVDVHGVANGQALVYDATTQKWVPGQGGGIDITAMWAALAQSGTQQIDASHLGTALTGYATETWVGNQGYITGSALNGYATESWVGSQISDMATKTWVSGNYLSKTDAAATYVSIAFFERLFKAYNGSTVVHPNNTTSTIDNIKAMFGFWTDFYLSALGNGSGGSTPGVTMAQVWSALGNSTTEQINISHLTTALSGYNPTSNFKTINGNSIIGTGNIVIQSSGGTVTAVKVGTTTYNPTDGVVSLPAYPTSLPASDVSAWAKAASKPSYSWSEIGSKPAAAGGSTTPVYWTGSGFTECTSYASASVNHATSADSATTASKLSTVSKTAWGQTYWTSGGVPTSISGDLSSVGNISFSASGKNIGGLMYFDTTNSNIGIGTSSPSYALDVVGFARAKLLFFYNRANTANAGYIGAGSTSVDYIYFQAYTNNGLYIGANNGFDFVILPNHNVGVGTTEPSHKMHVSGTFYASGNSSIGGTLGVTGATTLSSSLSVTGNSTLTGYVGIGTAASSSYALKVSGVAYASTGFYSGGYVTALSDIRHKDVMGDVGLTVSEVANAPAVKFLWKDRRQEGLQVGSIAQYWQKVLPEAIVEAADGELTMSYGVIALIAAIKTARKVEDLERRVNLLEQENRLLKEQLKVA
jgi:hypothetical protein